MGAPSAFERAPLQRIAYGLALLAGLAVLLPGHAAAQTARDLEQVIVDQNTIIQKYTPPPKRGTVELNLRGQPLSEAALAQSFRLREVDVEGASLLPPSDLAPIWADRLNKETTLKEIFAIAAAIEKRYREADYLVIAAVPDQDYASGRIRIVMFEDSFLSTVKFESDSPNLEPRLQPYIDRIVNMRPLRLREIERILLLMSDLYGVTVEGTLTRPDVPGEGGTLTLAIDYSHWQGRLGLDNRGTHEVGPLELSGWVQGSDLLGLFEDSSLTVVTVPDQPKELFYLQFGQDYPIGTDGLMFGYNVGQIWSEPGGDLKSADVKVSTTFTSTFVSYPFLRTLDNSVFGHLGFDTKDNDIDAFGQHLTRARNRWLSFGFDSSHDGEIASAALSGSFLQGLDILNATDTPSAGDADAAPDFSALLGAADVTFPLWSRFSWTSRVTGQYGFNRLPAAVQFSFGGDPYGRGFDSGAISGDSGIATAQELAFADPVDLDFLQGSSAFVFADYGAVWDRNNPLDDPEDTLGSTGVGLRAYFPYGIAATSTLTVPVKTVSGVADPGVKLFFTLSKRF